MTAIHDVASIAELVRAQLPNILTTKADALNVTKAVFENVAKSVQLGDSVNIYGFGKFSISERSARMGYNPQTQKPMQIQATRSLKFTPSKSTKKGALA